LKCGAGERWTDRVRNEEVSQRVKEEGSLKKYKEVQRSKVDWIGHISVVNVILNTLLKERYRGGV
jgi:hypothetical protein